jgi:hypothetical protein
MEITQRILALPLEHQQLLYQKISHIISSRDLTQIMEQLSYGVPIITAHQRQGIFERYTADILRFLEQLEHDA